MRGWIASLPEDETEGLTEHLIKTRDRVTFALPYDEARAYPPESIALVALDRDAEGASPMLEYVCRARKGDGITSFERRIVFERFTPFAPLSLDDLRESVPRNVQQYVGLGSMPETTSLAVLEAVKRLRPEARAAINRLSLPRSLPGWLYREEGEVVGYERDAVQLATRFAGVEDMQVLGTWEPTDDPTPFLTNLEGATVREDTILQSDMNVFGDWTRLDQYQTGAVLFGKGRRRLVVVNVNRTPLEETLGVDLIYYAHQYDAYVLVQYKMLRRETDAYVYRPAGDKSIEDEIKRMSVIPEGKWDSKPGNYRLGPSACYFKFCYTRVSPMDSTLARGLYVPLEFWKSLIGSGELVGPKGGVVLHSDHLPRHLSNTDFVALVKEGWIGSRGATSDLLQQVISESLHSGRSVTLARSFEEADLDQGEDESLLDDETLGDKLLRRKSRGEASGEVVKFEDLLDEL